MRIETYHMFCHQLHYWKNVLTCTGNTSLRAHTLRSWTNYLRLFFVFSLDGQFTLNHRAHNGICHNSKPLPKVFSQLLSVSALTWYCMAQASLASTTYIGHDTKIVLNDLRLASTCGRFPSRAFLVDSSAGWEVHCLHTT